MTVGKRTLRCSMVAGVRPNLEYASGRVLGRMVALYHRGLSVMTQRIAWQKTRLS
jgi:hypothetical protein